MSDACAWVTDRLAEYHAGRLDAEERRVLEDHLAACAACAVESRVLSALRRVPAPPAPAGRWDRLVDELADRAAAERARRGRPWRAPGLLRAAAIVIAIAGVSALGWWQIGPEAEGPWAEEPAPVAWEVLEGTSGSPWSESALPGWFTLDDLSVAELEELLEEVETT